MKTTIDMSSKLAVLMPERTVDLLDAQRAKVVRKFYGGRRKIKEIEEAAIATWEAHQRELEREQTEAKQPVGV